MYGADDPPSRPRTCRCAAPHHRILMIKFQNVTKTYKGSTVALQDCSVEIDKGEFVFLVGPSGSGKTTFIRLLLREEMPDSGRIWEAGKEIGHLAKWRIPYLRRNIGCVFQDFRLLPEQDRLRERGLRPRGDRPAQARDRLPGAPGPRPGRPGQEAGQPPPRALRRRAAAGGGGPGLRQPAADPPGRRADREPGPEDQPRHHAAARPDQPDRDHGHHRHPRRRHGQPDAPPGHRARPGHRRARPGPRRLRHRQHHGWPAAPARRPATWSTRCPPPTTIDVPGTSLARP